MPTCSLVKLQGNGLRVACNRPATWRLTSSTDPWPQQYACDLHEEIVSPELDVRKRI